MSLFYSCHFQLCLNLWSETGSLGLVELYYRLAVVVLKQLCQQLEMVNRVIVYPFCQCIGKSANWLLAALRAQTHMRSSKQASHGPLRNAQPIVIYSRFMQMCAWAYGTIYGCRPEMDLYVIPVLYTLSLLVCMKARWWLKACSRACLRACLRARLREPCFGRSRVLLHWKPLADGKLWVCWTLVHRHLWVRGSFG